MKKVKVGVFGGRRGYEMMKQLFNNPDAELVAVCDRYQPLLDTLDKAIQERGLQVALYNNFEDFLAHDGMDAVVLANYATEHVPFAIRCLEAGKHVMSETLPCETMAQAVELVEAVERTGLIYTFAENYCYMKAPFEMWRRYRNGDVGEVMYGEGEYVHDCSSGWHNLTYGDRNHWRNRLYSTYYCTHSVGPLLTITGLRPVQVVGFETNRNMGPKQMKIAYIPAGGLEMVTLENGAVIKSLHGALKHPESANFMLYGKLGMMESSRYNSAPFNMYQENEDDFGGKWEKYEPALPHAENPIFSTSGHGGSDFYPTHFFIQKILGRPEGEWCIDVYQALDMGFCGIMAHRSILAGNKPMPIPNFRNPEEREPFRNDHACTNPDIAGNQLLPRSCHELPEFGDEVYEYMRDKWLGKAK